MKHLLTFLLCLITLSGFGQIRMIQPDEYRFYRPIERDSARVDLMYRRGITKIESDTSPKSDWIRIYYGDGTDTIIYDTYPEMILERDSTTIVILNGLGGQCTRAIQDPKKTTHTKHFDKFLIFHEGKFYSEGGVEFKAPTLKCNSKECLFCEPEWKIFDLKPTKKNIHRSSGVTIEPKKI